MMFDLGGAESFVPSEGGGGAPTPEQIRESQQKFAGTSGAIQQIRKEEKKAKKRDDGVAHAILEFLTDKQRTHLATLISRLVARDCPSTFILAVLSLINDECGRVADTYIEETGADEEEEGNDSSETVDLVNSTKELDGAVNKRMELWIRRMELCLSIDGPTIVSALLVDRQNIDGTVLQLSTFVLQEYLQSAGRDVQFEQAQPIAGGILQSMFAPHMAAAELQQAEEEERETQE